MKSPEGYMSLSEFVKYMHDNRCNDYIVKLAYRYSYSREDYYISNEVMAVNEAGDIIWFNDWDEGQDDVYIISWCTVDEAFEALMNDRDNLYSKGFTDAEKIFKIPQGKWIEDNYITLKCSICNKLALDYNDYPYKSNFCPHCGAQMKGDNDNG